MKKKVLKHLCWVCPLLILLAVLGWRWLAGEQNKADAVTNFTPEFEQEQTQTTIAPSHTKGIKIPGYSTIPIAANSQEVEIDLYNPEENDVYFQIAFYLTDSKEQIFESKLLKPGQHLYSISLTRPLEAGDHPIIIQYSTFSTDGSYTPKNGAVVDCTLRAQA